MPRPNQYDQFGNVTTTASRLRPPAGLTKDVHDIFVLIVSATAPDHFAPAEAPLLVNYCQSLARCAKGEAVIEAEGEIVPSEKGPRPNPWLTIIKDARHQVAILATKLRLAPNARVESKQTKSGEGPVVVDFSKIRGATHE